MQPDETVSAKEASFQISKKATADLPPVLRCPQCHTIFKDAVMIPCCHHSFCYQCIRQELMARGKCPQCASPKFANADLLPNVALRQAIDRFLVSQTTSNGATDPLNQQQLMADMELAPPVKAAPAVPRLRIELRKPVQKTPVPAATPQVPAPDPQSTASPTTTEPVATEPLKEEADDVAQGSVSESVAGSLEKASCAGTDTALGEAAEAFTAVVSEIKPENSVEGPASKVESIAIAHPAVVKDVPCSAKEEGKLPVIDEGEGGMLPKNFEPPSHKEAEGVAVESEISKGKKKKKRMRTVTADGAMDHLGSNKSRKGDRFCYVCGSPEHIARDCPTFNGPHQMHPGMFGAGGPLPPAGMPSYGPDMYWHGPPMVHHGRPFPVNYMEGMYGPRPGMMPFEPPMMPNGLYGMPPYIPPIYHAGPLHDGFMGNGGPGMTHPTERPLSREEFMELQERERQRRLMQDWTGRDWSPDQSYLRDGNMRPPKPSPEQRIQRFADKRVLEEKHPFPDGENDSVSYSEGADHPKRTATKQVRLADSLEARKQQGASEDDASFDGDPETKGSYPGSRQPAKKMMPAGDKRDSYKRVKEESVERLSDSEPTDDRRSVRRKSREREPASKHGKQVPAKRSDEGRSWESSIGRGGASHSSRHRGKRTALEEPKVSSHREATHRDGKSGHEAERSYRSGEPDRKYIVDKHGDSDRRYVIEKLRDADRRYVVEKHGDSDRRHAPEKQHMDSDRKRVIEKHGDADGKHMMKKRSRSYRSEDVERKHGDDCEAAYEGAGDGANNSRRKHVSRSTSSKPKSKAEGVNYDGSDDLLKRKRRRQKKRGDDLEACDAVDVSAKLNRRHKSVTVSEAARWQLEYEQSGQERQDRRSGHVRHKYNGKAKRV